MSISNLFKRYIDSLYIIVCGGSFTNAKMYFNLNVNDKTLKNIAINAPFDKTYDRLFCTYAGVRFALGPGYQKYLLKDDDNHFEDSKTIHGFIVIVGENRIILFNNEEIVDEKYILLSKIMEKLERKFKDVPYLDVTFVFVGKEPKILKIDLGTDLLKNPNIYKFIKSQSVNLNFTDRNINSVKAAFNNLVIGMMNTVGKKRGMIGFMYRNWVYGCIHEFKSSRISDFPMIIWAHKKGFFGYHIKQYEITKKNYTRFLSDYDYKWLRPINGKSWRMLWDKISIWYVLQPYRQYLPMHYAFLKKKYISGKKKQEVYFITDNENQYATYNDLCNLIEQVSVVAAKPYIGSHGKGFYKIEKHSKGYILNGEKKSREELCAFFEQLDEPYVFTEYINMSEQFKEIYSDVVSTARIMLIKYDGEHSEIADAYLRIGNDEGGFTDNVSSGGIVAAIDLPTGKVKKAEKIKNHVFAQISEHPDTKSKLHIKINNWNYILGKLCEIGDFLYPLEYIGFDIAFTEDSFKIIEINTHPDLHKYNEYSDSVKQYLNKKLELKKKKSASNF